MKKFLFFPILFLIFGCINNTDNDEITINLTGETIKIQDAGIFKGYDIVKLETGDDFLVGDIIKMISHNDFFYIATKNPSPAVLIFNTEGKFIRKISSYGRGPGEYLDIASIFVDESAGTFNILNSYPPRLLTYAIDGSGIPETTTMGEVYLADIIPFADNYIGYTTVSSERGRKNIIVFDKTGNILQTELEYPQGWESYGFGDVSVFSKSDRRLYFKPIHSPEIYVLENNVFSPFVRLNFGQYTWPDDIKTSQDYRNRNTTTEFIGQIYNYTETEKYWLFNFIHKGQNMVAIYNKNTKKSMVCNLFMSTNEEPYLISFGSIIQMVDNKIITKVDALRLSDNFKNEELLMDYPEQMERLKQKIGDISPEDNPIIIIYHM